MIFATFLATDRLLLRVRRLSRESFGAQTLGHHNKPLAPALPRVIATRRFQESVTRDAPCCAAIALRILRLSSPGGHIMPITTLIVDDEKPARDELAFLLKSFPEIRLVGQGKNGVEALSLIKEHSPDLVFLDVHMPGLDGFGVIKRLVDRKAKLPHIVFATAFDNYAVQAFEVNAVDYVLKPFDRARLAKAIQRAKRLLEAEGPPALQLQLETLVSQIGASKASQPVKLLVKTQQRLLLVDADDVIFASIDDGIISVVAKDVEGSSNYRTIDELQESLDSDRFWRPHRSYLVNINHIKEVVPWFKSSYMLKMADKRNSEIPVSRAQTKRLRSLLRM
jgi:two-component system LytT family response regulator/two-component system response regulator LytT